MGICPQDKHENEIRHIINVQSFIIVIHTRLFVDPMSNSRRPACLHFDGERPAFGLGPGAMPDEPEQAGEDEDEEPEGQSDMFFIRAIEITEAQMVAHTRPETKWSWPVDEM